MDAQGKENDALARAETDGWQPSQRRIASVLTPNELSAVVVSPPIVAAIFRELHRIDPTIVVDRGEMEAMLVNDVISQNLLRGRAATAAERRVSQSLPPTQAVRSSQQIRRDMLQRTTSDQDSLNVAGDPR